MILWSNCLFSSFCVHFLTDILQNLDISVKACDDFYQSSCGGFVKSRHIGDEESSLDSFAITEDAVDHTLKDLLEDKESLSKFSKVTYDCCSFDRSCLLCAKSLIISN